MTRPRANGFTLVELVVVVAVVAVLSTLAAPGFTRWIATLRLKGVSGEFASDLHHARSESQRLRALVTVAFLPAPHGYRLQSGATVLKSVALPTGVNITFDAPWVFDPVRGHTAANAATLAHALGGTLRVASTATGRVSVCSPAGSVSGAEVCPP